MDASSDEIQGTSDMSPTSGETSSVASGSSRGGHAGEQPRCRQSSRLKEKTSRETQDAVSEDSGDAYNLRLSSLVKRVQVERRQSTPKQPKGKSKPPPLSKYRRRTANARERTRMQEMNEGFERLRECLPNMEEQAASGKKKEKPTKLTMLSLAINYIHALRDILGYGTSDGGSDGRSRCNSSNNNTDDGGTSISSVGSVGSSSSSTNNSNSSDSSVVTSNINNSPHRSIASNINVSNSSISSSFKIVTSNSGSSNSSSINSNNCSSSSSSSISSVATSPSAEWNLTGCEMASSRTLSISSTSCDELCSSPSPHPSATDLKELSLSLLDPPLVSAALPKGLLVRCHDPLPSSSVTMDFREEARASPTSSSSDHSLSPSPPPLPLPEECMELDQQDLLDMSMSMLDEMEDFVL